MGKIGGRTSQFRGRPAWFAFRHLRMLFRQSRRSETFVRSCFHICSNSCVFCFVFCFGSMAPRHTLRLRHLLASLKEVCQALEDSHPDIVEAVHSLEAAVNVGFPAGSRSRGKPPASVDKRICRLHNQIKLVNNNNNKKGNTFPPSFNFIKSSACHSLRVYTTL